MKVEAGRTVRHCYPRIILWLALVVVLVMMLGVFTSTASAAGIYSVFTYGAKGDGVTNDAAAIQRAIDAASATGGTVTFSAGTFRVDSVVYLESNVTVSGVTGGTVLYMPAKSAATPIFYEDGVSNVSIQNLTMRSDGPTGNVYGVCIKGGSQSCRLSHLRFEDCEYGMKLGGDGPVNAGLVIEDIATRHTANPLYLQDVHDSTFRRLDLEGAGTDGRYPFDHCIYLQVNVQDCTFEDLTLTKPSGTCFTTTGGYTGYSGRLVFRNMICDASQSGWPMALTDDATSQFDDVEFYNLTLIGANRENGAIIMLVAPTNLLFDGFQASGSDYLVRQYGTSSANGITFRNGNFNGVRLDYGNPVTRNLVFDSVTLNGPTYPATTTTTQGPTTTTTVAPTTVTTAMAPLGVRLGG